MTCYQRGIVKAAVTFYAVVNLGLPPWEKPRPEEWSDPLAFLQVLYDAYAGPVRTREKRNPRLSPCEAKLEQLPKRLLMVVPKVDILVQEQLGFATRLRREIDADPVRHEGRAVQVLYVEKGFHGYLGGKFTVPW